MAREARRESRDSVCTGVIGSDRGLMGRPVRQTAQGPELLPGTIQPGNIYGFNFGMGMAINERASFSIGYDHSSVGKTRLNGVAAPDTVRVQLGTLLLGLSWKLSPKRTLSLTLGAGVTRDTPDVTLTVRMPVSS